MQEFISPDDPRIKSFSEADRLWLDEMLAACEEIGISPKKIKICCNISNPSQYYEGNVYQRPGVGLTIENKEHIIVTMLGRNSGRALLANMKVYEPHFN